MTSPERMTESNLVLEQEKQRFRGAMEEIAAIDRRRRRRTLVLTVLMVAVATSWLAITVQTVRRLDQRAHELQVTINDMKARTEDLRRTQEDLLDFLGGVAAEEGIRLLDPGVDWSKTKAELIAMPAGPRKSALLSAILLAWKAVPFSLANVGLKNGLDSPHFVNLVLRRFGVAVEQQPGQRLSDAMMSKFKKVDTPLPGDLIFYRGNVGSFVVMYIGPGRPEGKGVAVGTLQTGEELRVLDTANINIPVYPFIGYFRVPYHE